MNSILKKVRKELTQNSNPSIASSGQRFFKEEIVIYISCFRLK